MPSLSSLHSAPPLPVAGIVLAAGEARRFRAPKLLLPFGRSTVIGCVAAALEAAGVAPLLVVAGARAEAIEEALRGAGARVLRNPDPRRGMLSSVQIGVGALPPGQKRFLLALGDQPRITSAGVLRLLAEQTRSERGIVIPTYGGRRGHPVIFVGGYRAAILALPETQSLRDVIHAHGDDCLEVACDSDGFISDIDTREEYHHELQRLEEQ